MAAAAASSAACCEARRVRVAARAAAACGRWCAWSRGCKWPEGCAWSGECTWPVAWGGTRGAEYNAVLACISEDRCVHVDRVLCVPGTRGVCWPSRGRVCAGPPEAECMLALQRLALQRLSVCWPDAGWDGTRPDMTGRDGRRCDAMR
eukprot:363099-Chlamydomonas_euryale.AAC.4